MNKFLFKIILFSLPVALVFLFPLFVIVSAQEYVTSQEIVKRQLHDEALFGYAYNGVSYYPYKKELLQQTSPEVIVLGTSRVMQLRKEFFSTTTNFINAGGMARSIDDIAQIVQNDIPDDGKKRVLIIGFDQEAFHFPETKYGLIENPYEGAVALKLSVTEARRIYLDYIHKKFSAQKLLSYDTSTRIGLVAAMLGDGFRPDGSYAYTSAKTNAARNDAVKQGVKEKARTFSDMSEQEDRGSLVSLENLLTLAKKRNMDIVGFMNPIHPALYDARLRTGGLLRDDITVLPRTVRVMFEKYGMEFYDYSAITSFGGKETEFVDTIHGTDVMYLKLFADMASHSRILRSFVDKHDLVKKISELQGDFLSF